MFLITYSHSLSHSLTHPLGVFVVASGMNPVPNPKIEIEIVDIAGEVYYVCMCLGVQRIVVRKCVC